MTLARLIQVIAVLSAAAVLSGGRMRIVDGSGSRAGAARPAITMSVKDILLSADEVRAAVGNDLPAHERRSSRD
ncbi:MAG: hypothetical protein ACLP3C_22820 [Mycobacterium sp.]|uniref:hypothetical protein n=1 Tax=Mycobacterium sp. TaxID=1785 RepID=UPI003F963F49